MDDKQAVSPIISMVLLIGIVLVVTTVILSWAAPLLQRSQSEAHYGSALGYFNALDSVLEDVSMSEGASRTVDVSIGAGNIYMGESMNETWIVSYGFEGQPRVNFSGLDDSGPDFGINSTKGINVTITVSWYDSNGDYVDCNNTTDKSLSGGSLESITVHRDIVGTVNITINDNSTNALIAQLWLFDITPISYELSSAFGTYYIKSVNGGIITQATGEKYVTDAPFIKETENSILLYMIQTKTTETSLTGGGPGHYSFALKNMDINIRNNISMDVCNLTLQIYDKQDSKWADAWRSYFTTGWENAKINGNEHDYIGFVGNGEVLLYKTEKTDKSAEYGTKPITLKLMSCNIDVNMESK